MNNVSLAVKVSWMNGLWRRSLNRQYSCATKLDTHTATATRTSRNVIRNTDVPGAGATGAYRRTRSRVDIETVCMQCSLLRECTVRCNKWVKVAVEERPNRSMPNVTPRGSSRALARKRDHPP